MITIIAAYALSFLTVLLFRRALLAGGVASGLFLAAVTVAAVTGIMVAGFTAAGETFSLAKTAGFSALAVLYVLVTPVLGEAPKA